MYMIDEKEYINIGKRIVSIRASRGISQAELSRLVDTARRNMCAYEKGTRRIPAPLLANIADALNVTTDEILGIKNLSLDPRGWEFKLMKRFQKISQLPEDKRKTLVHIVDTLLSDAAK
jgi:transcriptional regulator with XRE-family HTH domain